MKSKQVILHRGVKMIDISLMVSLLVIIAIAILFVATGILFAVKSGFNQVITGLQSIDETLRDKKS